MNNDIHPNYIKASNLMFWSVALMVIGILLSGKSDSFGALIFTVFVFVIIALIVRAGHAWMKYVLLVLIGIGVLFEPFVLLTGMRAGNGIGVLINMAQTVLQIVVVVKLWRIPKTPNEKNEIPNNVEDTVTDVPADNSEETYQNYES